MHCDAIRIRMRITHLLRHNILTMEPYTHMFNEAQLLATASAGTRPVPVIDMRSYADVGRRHIVGTVHIPVAEWSDRSLEFPARKVPFAVLLPVSRSKRTAAEAAGQGADEGSTGGGNTSDSATEGAADNTSATVQRLLSGFQGDITAIVYDDDAGFWSSVPQARLATGPWPTTAQARLWQPSPMVQPLVKLLADGAGLEVSVQTPAGQSATTAGVDRTGFRILDAGAGTGRNAVAILHALPQAVVVAVDNRKAMCEKLAKFGSRQGLCSSTSFQTDKGRRVPSTDGRGAAEPEEGRGGTGAGGHASPVRLIPVQADIGAFLRTCTGHGPVLPGAATDAGQGQAGSAQSTAGSSGSSTSAETSKQPPAPSPSHSPFHLAAFFRFVDKPALRTVLQAMEPWQTGAGAGGVDSDTRADKDGGSDVDSTPSTANTVPAAANDGNSHVLGSAWVAVESFHASSPHPSGADQKLQEGELLQLLQEGLGQGQQGMTQTLPPAEASGSTASSSSSSVSASASAASPAGPDSAQNASRWSWSLATVHEEVVQAEDGRPLLQVVVRADARAMA